MKMAASNNPIVANKRLNGRTVEIDSVTLVPCYNKETLFVSLHF